MKPTAAPTAEPRH